MDYLSTKYGLTGEVDPVSENGQLFLSHYILLIDFLNKELQNKQKACQVMEEQLKNSEVEEGLYNRNPDLTQRTMSHDNLTGIMSYSFSQKTNHRFLIWKYLLRHLGIYDNTKGKSSQLSRFLPFNPANFFIWGLCAESFISYLFFPFFLINLVITCNKPKEDTSGKILDFVAMLPLKDKFLVKKCFAYYEGKMKEQYGENYIKELVKIYHGGNSSDFPLNKIVEDNNEI